MASRTTALLALAVLLAAPLITEGRRRRVPFQVVPPTLIRIEGTLEVQGVDNGPDLYWLDTKLGQRALSFNTPVPEEMLVGGSTVAVYVKPDSATDRTSSLQVEYYEFLALPPDMTRYYSMGGVTVNFTSLVLVTRVCGMEARINVTDFRDRWHEELGAPKGLRTFQEYMETCSYGKMRFAPEDNLVVGPIDLPCNGTSAEGSRFTWGSCTPEDVYGWAQMAEAIAREQFGVDTSAFRHRLVVLPSVPGCGWNGLAEVGCGEKCHAWVRGGNAWNLSTIMHELGHNLALEHALVPGNPTGGDRTDPTGGCCNLRCPNAPHLWQLGWAEASADLDSGGVPAGEWTSFTLASTALSDSESMVRITADWVFPEIMVGGPGADDATSDPPKPQSVFLSYRTADGYDVGLEDGHAQHVSVHTYNGTRYRTDASRTLMEAALGADEAWGRADSTLRLVVRVTGVSAINANVTVCRSTHGEAMEFDCGDQLDNDCDGLIDKDDPDCQLAALPGVCNGNGKCDAAAGETAELCPDECPAVCGDGFCDLSRNETAKSCAKDCPGRCGDEFCDRDRGETHASCEDDCPPDVCGDGVCDSGENPVSCPKDCCGKPTCGDGLCDAWAGEDCTNCPRDCKANAKVGLCCGSSLGSCANPLCGKGPLRCRRNCLV